LLAVFDDGAANEAGGDGEGTEEEEEDDDDDGASESDSLEDSNVGEESETRKVVTVGVAYGARIEVRRWTHDAAETTAAAMNDGDGKEGEDEEGGGDDLDSDSDDAYGGYSSSSEEGIVARMKRLRARPLGTCERIDLTDDATPHTGTIRAFRASPDGRWFVSGGDDKLVKLWRAEGAWRCVRTVARGKKIFSACFTPDSKHVLFADKFGEVHTFAVDSEEDPVLMLAHCSTIITDVECMEGGSRGAGYVLTGDREHKTRVSVLPKAEDRTRFACSAPEIQSFCYGHDEYISCIRPITQSDRKKKKWLSKDTFITGGGDGAVRMWDAQTGKQTDPHSAIEFYDGEIYDIATRREGTHVSVAMEGRKSLAVVHLTQFKGVPKLFIVGFGPDWAEEPQSIKFDRDMILWGAGVRKNKDGSHTAVLMRECEVIDELSVTLSSEESAGTSMSSQLKKKEFSEQERNERKQNRLDVRLRETNAAAAANM
jgi:tRNA (guanine-N(7)-)-methyltransferase subunit TRM82